MPASEKINFLFFIDFFAKNNISLFSVNLIKFIMESEKEEQDQFIGIAN
jgi:hypothetical protein